MHRSLAVIVLALVAFAALAGGSFTAPPAASAATVIGATTTCNNGLDNEGGLGAICEVTIENTITASGGSAVVTVRECHGAAGDPEAACTGGGVPVLLTEPVTSVNQCNGSTNGGGGTLRCSVEITNTFILDDPDPTGVTVNQCVGSGESGIIGDTIVCDPFPATTTGAAIDQCNGSANGGTLVGLICEATGTSSTAFDVTIDQCNDSANGGGALVICSASIETVYAPAPTPTPTPSPTPTSAPVSSASASPNALVGGRPTPPATGTGVETPAAGGAIPWAVAALVVIFMMTLATSTTAIRRLRQ